GMSVCLLLVLFTLTANTQVSSGKSLKLLQEQWRIYTNECIQSLISAPPAAGPVCNRTFDQYVCWPDGSPGTTVNVSCPWYLPWYRKGKALTLCLKPTIRTDIIVLLCSRTVSGCRVAMVMMQYSVMANNYWLLVEGLYLHSLLVITVFSERNYFYIYLCIGWGASAIGTQSFIITCWERNINMGYWWIIRSPILFAPPYFLLLFYHASRAHALIKCVFFSLALLRLAKSTLTLIPLLGIHAILFTFVIDESVPKESLLRLIRLFYDLLFSSFQGLLVAILYCFVNKEVQSEILKKWKRWKLGKDIEEEYRHTHSQTPHAKSGSMAPAMTHECPESPELAASASQRLVTGLQNGVSQNRSRVRLQLTSEPQEGASNCSSLTEDICLEERPLNSECSAVVTETNL
uniref:Glucagon receptor b n=1 Tax=Sinocyclocheilus anshuiensis TaxID=1608454 RepID=A0A671NJK2_9TELE